MNALVEYAMWLLSHSSSQLFMCQAMEAGTLSTWPRPRCAFAWTGAWIETIHSVSAAWSFSWISVWCPCRTIFHHSWPDTLCACGQYMDTKGQCKTFLLNLVSRGSCYVNWNPNILNIYKFIQLNIVRCISSFEWSETRWFINYCFLALLWYMPLGRSKK
jgi:hypothetical protein